MPYFLSQEPIDESLSYKAGELLPINLSEYQQGVADFNKYFKIGGKLNRAYLIPVKRSVLDAFVAQEVQLAQSTENPPLNPSAYQLENAIVVFYYGYDSVKDKVKRGLRVLFHSENCDSDGFWWLNQPITGVNALPSHEFVESTLEITVAGRKHFVHKILPITSASDWGGYQDDYFDNSRHLQPKDDPNPQFNILTRGVDPEAVYFPYYDEIRQLAIFNQNAAMGNEMYYLISDYASYIVNGQNRVRVNGPNGYYHSLSLHMAYFNNYLLVQLLKDGNAVNAINRGMDYGHLCPPRCNKAQLEKDCVNP